MLTFKDIVDEVKQRATRNQGGNYFDTTIKNIINSSLLRIAREGKWRCLRRATYFPVITSYTSGTNYITVTNSSTSVTVSGCNLWTDKIEIGRRIKFGTDSNYYEIRAVNSNTTLTIDLPYRGTTSTGTTYEIMPQTEYSLPIQVDHRSFLWHEDFGYPYRMFYVPDQTFYDTRIILNQKYTPTHYRMWGENFIKTQVPTATPLCIVSNSTADTSTKVIVFGDVDGSPNYEEVTLNGTTTVTTTNAFCNIERIAKNSNTTGKVTITSSRGSYEIVTIPAGDTTAGVKYSKVQLFAMPTRVFNINVHYYKDPYRLVNDDDVHEMGQEFDEAIILLSVAKIKYQEAQQEGDKWFALYTDELKNLMKTNVDKIDWIPILKRPSQDRTDPFVVKNLLFRQVGPAYGPQSRM
jgi:hypothetical protein